MENQDSHWDKGNNFLLPFAFTIFKEFSHMSYKRLLVKFLKAIIITQSF